MLKTPKHTFTFIALSFLIGSLPTISKEIPSVTPRIIRLLPHTGNGFTQGLLVYQNKLYEGTGLYNKSRMNILDLKNGEELGTIPLKTYFGEGIAVIKDRLIQLTWKGGKAFVYSFPTLKRLGHLEYKGEGWGLTNDENNFIMSNGSDTLFIRNTEFQILKKIPVTYEGLKMGRLNELERVGNYVYANVFMKKFIVEIEISSGKVTRIINCENLFAVEKPASLNKVLNGIAFDTKSRTFYLTGKNWNNIFEVVIPLP